MFGHFTTLCMKGLIIITDYTARREWMNSFLWNVFNNFQIDRGCELQDLANLGWVNYVECQID